MYLNFKVEVPAFEGGISRKTIKGTPYIYYEHGRKYYSDKVYAVVQCTSIGKLCEVKPGMMIPNGYYLKFSMMWSCWRKFRFLLGADA